MSITKDFRYEVGVAWEGDRITSVTADGQAGAHGRHAAGVQERRAGRLVTRGPARRLGRIVLRRDAGRRRRATRSAALRPATSAARAT